MLSLRYVRRKLPGVICKLVAILVVLSVLIELSSSYPRLPIRNESNNAMGDVERNVNIETKPLALNVKAQSQEQLGAVKSKKDRTGEFYENIYVHLDLKGAPPKVPYFLKLLHLIFDSGATGILLEWEDMFPWEGSLKVVRNSDAYSLEDVKQILGEAKRLGLDVVPLVQTFGHLEWFLKFEEFRKYRENDAYPQVLCLGDEDGVAIVKEAIRQVVEVHKPYGIPFFHIGADEAFEFGVCQKSREWINAHGGGGGKQVLALTHLRNIARYTKELIGETTILAWHDMLKSFQSNIIRQLDLGSLIEPVIWDYSEGIITMNDWSFSSLAESFPVVWASSAYKGANFPSAKYIDVRHYEKNNMEWLNVKKRQESKYRKFHGIIITGWQRYDHMAALCEILPIGTVSMVLNVKVALNGASFNQGNARNEAASVLGCSSYQVAGLNLISNQCTFPGFKVYSIFQGQIQNTISYIETEIGKNHDLMGWLSRYSVRHGMAQPWYLNRIIGFLTPLLKQIDGLETQLRTEMKQLFFDNTIDEFLFLNTRPTSDKLRQMLHDAQQLIKLRTFPKRHFAISDEL